MLYEHEILHILLFHCQLPCVLSTNVYWWPNLSWQFVRNPLCNRLDKICFGLMPREMTEGEKCIPGKKYISFLNQKLLKHQGQFTGSKSKFVVVCSLHCTTIKAHIYATFFMLHWSWNCSYNSWLMPCICLHHGNFSHWVKNWECCVLEK